MPNNARYFEERLRRKIARARRYDRRLGLLVFDLGAGGGSTLVAAGERIRTAVRATDIASHRGEARFAIILPEVAEADAERLHRRVQFALGGRVDSGATACVSTQGSWSSGLRTTRPSSASEPRPPSSRAKQAAADRLSAAQ